MVMPKVLEFNRTLKNEKENHIQKLILMFLILRNYSIPPNQHFSDPNRPSSQIKINKQTHYSTDIFHNNGIKTINMYKIK